MRGLLTVILLAGSCLAFAQGDSLAVKWFEVRPSKSVLIKYEGQRGDPDYKQGMYKVYYRGTIRVNGRYFRNRKHSEWEKYDAQQVALRIT